MTNTLMDLPFVTQTRRNHALEHATLHMLSAKYPESPLMGHSNPTGYFIVGPVSTEDVASAATEALERLRAGESKLAVHAGCGTNLATSALLAASLAWLVLRDGRSVRGRLLRLPFAMLLAVLGLALSRPLGPMLQQRFTTDAEMGDMQLVEVRASARGRLTAHRVITRS